MVKIIIKILKGKRLINLTHKYIQVTEVKVNPNSPISTEYRSILCQRVHVLYFMDPTDTLPVWYEINLQYLSDI